MISYSGLLQKLDEKGLTNTALAKELGISSRTVAKIGERKLPIMFLKKWLFFSSKFELDNESFIFKKR